jgi:hypothetical protein
MRMPSYCLTFVQMILAIGCRVPAACPSPSSSCPAQIADFQDAERSLKCLVAEFRATPCGKLLTGATLPEQVWVRHLDGIAKYPALMRDVRKEQAKGVQVNAVTELGGRVIYLNPFVFGSSQRIRALLFHEYLHAARWTDRTLQSLLCRAGPGPSTSCITTAVMRGCPSLDKAPDTGWRPEHILA